MSLSCWILGFERHATEQGMTVIITLTLRYNYAWTVAWAAISARIQAFISVYHVYIWLDSYFSSCSSHSKCFYLLDWRTYVLVVDFLTFLDWWWFLTISHHYLHFFLKYLLPTRHSHHRMSWPYKKVLVIGATSGIGEALATRCVKAGSSVIVSGRRSDNLEDFIHRHGEKKCSALQFDITELEKIPDFAAEFERLTFQ